MDFCRPKEPHTIQELMHISTPLDADTWEAALQSHPDRAYVTYIVRGLRGGFRIGFQWGASLRSAKINMPLTRLLPEVIADYISKEVGKEQMIGSLPASVGPLLYVSHFGLILKGWNSGKFA